MGKINRAKKHIKNIETMKNRLLGFGGKRDRIVVEDDPKTRDRVFRIRGIPKAWDVELALIIGDAIHNLRASLDLLVWQLVLVNCQCPGDNTGFPILKRAEDFKTSGNGKVKGCSKEAVRVLKSLKPYRRSNKRLWNLHRLDIADKHRLLIPIGVALQVTRPVQWIEPDKPGGQATIVVKSTRRKFALKDRAIFWRLPPRWRNNPEVHMNANFTFDIVFGKGEVLHGKPVIRTLHELLDTVQNIIKRFEPFFPADRGSRHGLAPRRA